MLLAGSVLSDQVGVKDPIFWNPHVVLWPKASPLDLILVHLLTTTPDKAVINQGFHSVNGIFLKKARRWGLHSAIVMIVLDK